jgi:signal transduction histidine kinase
MNFNQKQHTILHFKDITGTVQYRLEKSHNQVLEMINACVSHEMRNPLNSIVAQNIEKEFVYEELEDTLRYFKATISESSMTIIQQRFFIKCSDIIKKLQNGLKVQKSSANVLAFIV